jgi:hypothetical protein
MIKFYKPNEKTEIHNIASKKYSKLYRNDRRNVDVVRTFAVPVIINET